ncbi:nuclear transport factor 2 family protein [Mycobacterium sp.]|uniref:nuclear transport factor 2 family protein n=1 Tax=Mycobacterium sp. TaxID=1785 RepID=UPI003D0E3F8C
MTTDTDHLVTARQILDATDNDIEAFLGFFSDTTVFRMGSGDPVIGREAITTWIGRYLASVETTVHEAVETWESDDGIAIRLNVTYRMRGGQSFTLPAVTEMKLDADKLTHYLIFMDPSPITAVGQ